jgi:NAD(P)-dependent dehydrogenase (short-subunit alcohol dehydrogenase family)
MARHIDTKSFSGRTAIVTGAASGIGREIATQLTEAGAIVTATDLPGLGVESLDVTSREQIQATVDRVVEQHGRLDYMFNNAGVAIFGEMDIVTLDDWDKIIDVNLRGVAYGSAIAYRQMVAQGGGHIVNTASVAGLVPVPLQAHYCATKHGVVGLSKTLAVEARGHGIGVTVFCPAFVETGMMVNNTLRGSMEGADARKLVPIKPLPADVAVRRLLAGVAAGKGMVITPAYGRVGWWLERLSPRANGRLQQLLLRETRRRAARSRP